MTREECRLDLFGRAPALRRRREVGDGSDPRLCSVARCRRGPPLLSVFGGKITTYRKLAEDAFDKLARFFPGREAHWTAGVPLPGGDFPVKGAGRLEDELRRDYPFLSGYWARRMVRHYGLETREIFGTAKSADDLGEDFGATLTAAEVDWLMRREYARSAEDVVWRRTKTRPEARRGPDRAGRDPYGRAGAGRWRRNRRRGRKGRETPCAMSWP